MHRRLLYLFVSLFGGSLIPIRHEVSSVVNINGGRAFLVLGMSSSRSSSESMSISSSEPASVADEGEAER